MKYNAIVLIKQVTDTKNITGEAMREDGTVNRAALPAIFNPDDLNALESALSVRDKFGGSDIWLLVCDPNLDFYPADFSMIR